MDPYRDFHPVLLSSTCSPPWVFLPGFLGPLELELSWNSVAGNGSLVISTTSADTWYAAFSALLIFSLSFPSFHALMSPTLFILLGLFISFHFCGAPRRRDQHMRSDN